MNKVSLSLQGKLAVFVATDKIWAFKQKLEFQKICHCMLDIFPLLQDFPDEINGDTDEKGFLILYN